MFRSIRADRTDDTLFINNDGRLSWRGHVNAVWAGGMCETDANIMDKGLAQALAVGATGKAAVRWADVKRAL